MIHYAIVVAKDENNLIGGENRLLWHLPADLKYFKNLTSGNIIIMGRKTFESIGKALPNRLNIVISRGNYALPEGVLMAKNLEQALEMAVANIQQAPEKKIFVVGGAQIYKIALENAAELYVTEVKASFVGDSYFPPIDTKIWKETERVHHPIDEKNHLEFDFVTYKKSEI